MKESIFQELFLNMIQLMPLFHEKVSPAYERVDRIDKVLNKSQIKTVMMIGRKGKMTSTMLGKGLDMKKGSLTTLVDMLEEKGFVYRKRDEKDRRKTWIQLTDKGEKYRCEKYKLLEKEYTELVSKLSEEDILELNMSIGKVIDIMRKL